MAARPVERPQPAALDPHLVAPRAPSDWVAREPGLRTALHELGRFRRRAMAHPVATLVVAALLTGVVVARRARSAPPVRARIVFRVTEGDLDVGTAPRPNRELRAFVNEVAFSNQHLAELARRRGLYAHELKRSPVDAAESFRDDIDVDVWRNYFLEGRANDDPARSARISISYRSRDPHEAYEVVQDLGRLVVEANQSGRVATARAAAEAAAAAVEAERDEQLARRRALTASRLRAGARPSPSQRLELDDLRAAVEADEERLAAREQRRAQLDLRVGIEERALGVQYQIADAGRPPSRARSRTVELLLLGTSLFAALLPLVAIAFGAFDKRVYDGDDVRRLGLVVVGSVPRFEGDDRAPLRERQRRRRPPDGEPP